MVKLISKSILAIACLNASVSGSFQNLDAITDYTMNQTVSQPQQRMWNWGINQATALETYRVWGYRWLTDVSGMSSGGSSGGGFGGAQESSEDDHRDMEEFKQDCIQNEIGGIPRCVQGVKDAMDQIYTLCVIESFVTGGIIGSVLRSFNVAKAVETPTSALTFGVGAFTCSGWRDSVKDTALQRCESRAISRISDRCLD